MMVFSKASGIMFSVDVSNGDDSKIVIDAIRGLGEYIVLGKVTPNHFVIDKKTQKIIDKTVVKQTVQLSRIAGGGTKEEPVPAELQDQQVITDDQVIELAGYAKKIEEHYGCYMDMEYALDVNTNRLWIVKLVQRHSGHKRIRIKILIVEMITWLRNQMLKLLFVDYLQVPAWLVVLSMLLMILKISINSSKVKFLLL
jgi:Phosphoenolpyruvate synthase/pyruvate phosphate dikinase